MDAAKIARFERSAPAEHELLTAPQPSNGAVDPRIAATGGTRTNPKKNYEWPGMMRESDWRRTRVHEYTSSYGCAKCGQAFKTPHAVYTHLDKRHPAPGSVPRSGALPPAEAHPRGTGREREGVR